MCGKENSFQVNNYNDDEIEEKIKKGLGKETGYAVDVDENAKYMGNVSYRIDEGAKRICVIPPDSWCWDTDGLQIVVAEIKKMLDGLAMQKSTDWAYEQLQKIDETRYGLNGKEYETEK